MKKTILLILALAFGTMTTGTAIPVLSSTDSTANITAFPIKSSTDSTIVLFHGLKELKLFEGSVLDSDSVSVSIFLDSGKTIVRNNEIGIEDSFANSDTGGNGCIPPTCAYLIKIDTANISSIRAPTLGNSPDSIVPFGAWASLLTSFNKSTGAFTWTPIDTITLKACSVSVYKASCSNVYAVCTLNVVYGQISLTSATPRYIYQNGTIVFHGHNLGIYTDSIHLTGPDSLAPIVWCTNDSFAFTLSTTADTGWRDTVVVSDGISADTLFDTVYHVAVPPPYVLPTYPATTVFVRGFGTASFTADSGAIYQLRADSSFTWDSSAATIWTATGGAHLSSTSIKNPTVWFSAAGNMTATFYVRKPRIPVIIKPQQGDTLGN